MAGLIFSCSAARPIASAPFFPQRTFLLNAPGTVRHGYPVRHLLRCLMPLHHFALLPASSLQSNRYPDSVKSPLRLNSLHVQHLVRCLIPRLNYGAGHTFIYDVIMTQEILCLEYRVLLSAFVTWRRLYLRRSSNYYIFRRNTTQLFPAHFPQIKYHFGSSALVLSPSHLQHNSMLIVFAFRA